MGIPIRPKSSILSVEPTKKRNRRKKKDKKEKPNPYPCPKDLKGWKRIGVSQKKSPMPYTIDDPNAESAYIINPSFKVFKVGKRRVVHIDEFIGEIKKFNNENPQNFQPYSFCVKKMDTPDLSSPARYLALFANEENQSWLVGEKKYSSFTPPIFENSHRFQKCPKPSGLTIVRKWSDECRKRYSNDPNDSTALQTGQCDESLPIAFTYKQEQDLWLGLRLIANKICSTDAGDGRRTISVVNEASAFSMFLGLLKNDKDPFIQDTLIPVFKEMKLATQQNAQVVGRQDQKDMKWFQVFSGVGLTVLSMGTFIGYMHFQNKKAQAKKEKFSEIAEDITNTVKTEWVKEFEKYFGRDAELRKALSIVKHNDSKHINVEGLSGIGKDDFIKLIIARLFSERSDSHENQLYEKYKNAKVFKIPVSKFKSDTKYQGVVGGRIDALREYVANTKQPVIIIIEEIDTLLNWGGTSGNEEGNVGTQLLSILFNHRDKFILLSSTSRGVYEKHPDMIRRTNLVKLKHYSTKILHDIIQLKFSKKAPGLSIDSRVYEMIVKSVNSYAEHKNKEMGVSHDIGRYSSCEEIFNRAKGIIYDDIPLVGKKAPKTMTVDHIAMALLSEFGEENIFDITRIEELKSVMQEDFTYFDLGSSKSRINKQATYDQIKYKYGEDVAKEHVTDITRIWKDLLAVKKGALKERVNAIIGYEVSRGTYSKNKVPESFINRYLREPQYRSDILISLNAMPAHSKNIQEVLSLEGSKVGSLIGYYPQMIRNAWQQTMRTIGKDYGELTDIPKQFVEECLDLTANRGNHFDLIQERMAEEKRIFEAINQHEGLRKMFREGNAQAAETIAYQAIESVKWRGEGDLTARAKREIDSRIGSRPRMGQPGSKGVRSIPKGKTQRSRSK